MHLPMRSVDSQPSDRGGGGGGFIRQTEYQSLLREEDNAPSRSTSVIGYELVVCSSSPTSPLAVLTGYHLCFLFKLHCASSCTALHASFLSFRALLWRMEEAGAIVCLVLLRSEGCLEVAEVDVDRMLAVFDIVGIGVVRRVLALVLFGDTHNRRHDGMTMCARCWLPLPRRVRMRSPPLALVSLQLRDVLSLVPRRHHLYARYLRARGLHLH
jgi:hypothetical protein